MGEIVVALPTLDELSADEMAALLADELEVRDR